MGRIDSLVLYLMHRRVLGGFAVEWQGEATWPTWPSCGRIALTDGEALLSTISRRTLDGQRMPTPLLPPALHLIRSTWPCLSLQPCSRQGTTIQTLFFSLSRPSLRSLASPPHHPTSCLPLLPQLIAALPRPVLDIFVAHRSDLSFVLIPARRSLHLGKHHTKTRRRHSRERIRTTPDPISLRQNTSAV